MKETIYAGIAITFMALALFFYTQGAMDCNRLDGTYVTGMFGMECIVK